MANTRNRSFTPVRTVPVPLELSRAYSYKFNVFPVVQEYERKGKVIRKHSKHPIQVESLGHNMKHALARLVHGGAGGSIHPVAE